MVDRKSAVLIGAMRWGNAHGAKGDTEGSLVDGNVTHTQRWTADDNGRRTDSPSGSAGPAGAIYLADAPLHGGQPARMLRVARWQDGDRSRWRDQSEVWAAPGGKPPGAPSETAPDVVPAQAGTPGGDSQGRRYQRTAE
jgi:hypothetical protein